VIAGIIHEKPTLPVGFSASTPSYALTPRPSATIDLSPYPRPVSELTNHSPTDLRRAGYFTALLLIVNLVGDGWTGRPVGLMHQLLLLPATCAFLWCLYQLLSPAQGSRTLWTTHLALFITLIFELTFIVLYIYECHHFAAFGYRSRLIPATLILGAAATLLGFTLRVQVTSAYVFGVTLFASMGGLLLSIISFPLNYLRSDMLPVIFWADRSLLLHVDPYTTLHVANRIYDFPYLPGMMLAFYPFAALGLDLRFGSMAYLLAMVLLIYWAARRDRRLMVAALLALFLLCPFLQYRHELYLQPHWFTLVLAFVLMQRRHFAWAALVFGISMAIYQFSWILFPFFLLNAFRRRGWMEAVKLALLGVLGALVVAGPFLRSASQRIANNTVGQWGHLSHHARAQPMNLSFWATYLIAPNKLLRLQAVLMVGIFLYCCARGRCADLAGTLRWMIVALTTFVLFNVLIDGYFFLMLLVPMLVYTCIASGWWAEPQLSPQSTPQP